MKPIEFSENPIDKSISSAVEERIKQPAFSSSEKSVLHTLYHPESSLVGFGNDRHSREKRISD